MNSSIVRILFYLLFVVNSSGCMSMAIVETNEPISTEKIVQTKAEVQDIEMNINISKQEPDYESFGMNLNEPDETNEYDRSQGLTLVFPGIEGSSPLNWSIARGLKNGGIKGEIQIADWTTGRFYRMLSHLSDSVRTRESAVHYAQQVIEYRSQYPDAPVWLVGHSGGGALTAMILELLPEGMQVEGAIMLCTALSPDYDLTSALEHTKQGIYNHRSTMDFFFLKWGTSLFGTLDRAYGYSAGSIGFRLEADPGHPMHYHKLETYRTKLHDRPWDLSMISSGHYGGHCGSTSPWYVQRYVVPEMLSNSLADLSD